MVLRVLTLLAALLAAVLGAMLLSSPEPLALRLLRLELYPTADAPGASGEYFLPPWPAYSLLRKGMEILEGVLLALIPPHLRLMKQASGFMETGIIAAAAELGIADVMKDDSYTSQELAAKLDVDAKSLERLLHALELRGLFHMRQHDRRWEQTQLSRLLRADHPQSLRDMVLMFGSEQYQAFGDVHLAVRTGQPSFRHRFGSDLWTYLQRNPRSQRVFDGSMTVLSKIVDNAVISEYDFSKARTICDVGGGHGKLLEKALKLNSHLKGILFDQPVVIEQAIEVWKNNALADRVQLVPGSFFDKAPQGADVYMMKQIIHDWSDEDSIRILKSVRAVIPASGRLLVIDRLMRRNVGPLESEMTPFADILMMSNFGSARERFLEEFDAVFSASGFNLTRAIPTRSSFWIFEGIPI